MSENSLLSLNDKPSTGGVISTEIDPVKYEQFMRDVKSRQNLVLAIFAGFAASIIAAILWATLTYVTNLKIGYAAVGVGFLVGFAVRYVGKGITPAFGVVGAAFALFGCLFGDVLTTIIAASFQEGVPLSMILNAFLDSPGIIVEILKETFSPIDLLFYGIAVYEGYKFSLRRIDESELVDLRKTQSAPATLPQIAPLETEK